MSGLKTVGAFLNRRACPDTLFHVLNNCAFHAPLALEERAAQPLAGGIMQHGHQCGMIWGAALAAGAQAWRLCGPGPLAEAGAIAAARRLIDSFQRMNHAVNCEEITGTTSASTPLQLTTYFLLKGGTIGCFRMAANYAPVAFNEINAALAKRNYDLPSAPVSCTALLARRMGADEKHAVMAAGLAGGIGLSGMGCGALGAAVWLSAMRQLARGGKPEREAEAVVGRFVKATGGEFECARIVGRGFADLADHAAYLHAGGCGAILDALANA